jgi:phosphoglycerol transferase MdoB-like AlkP superfamily enzyme
MLERFVGSRGLLLARLFLIFLIPFTLLRLIFYFTFASDIGNRLEVTKAFYLGLKFDTRVLLVLLLIPALGMLIPSLNPFRSKKAQAYWTTYGTFCFAFAMLFYVVDFAYYSYLGLRANATILMFLENPEISAEMVWQTYPVIKIILGVVCLTILFSWAQWKILQKCDLPQTRGGRRWLQGSVVTILFLSGIYGKFSAYPLRWSEAYFSTNSFVTSLGMNPIHYFFDTFNDRERPYDLNKVKKYYPIVSKYLGVDNPDTEKLNFDRWLIPRPQLPSNTNVVLIIMESFAAHKTGTFGHPLDPTPYFDALAKNGKLFTRYHVPSEGTARSIFTALTGIPDVMSTRTSSRNPLIVDQHILINAFKEHQKFYFLGGSANWGNIRGVIANNIPDMKIFEEGMFKTPSTDVWGISDYQLFNEVHDQLSSLPPDQSFFTVVQTAGFHRPYTIPADRGEFTTKDLGKEELTKYGLVSNDEYNSLRFSDYSLGHFMEIAKKAPYYKNTLFVVIGDHGLPDLDAAHLPEGSRLHHLTRFHVPLLFFHPQWDHPERIETFATEPDVLVTISSLTGHKTLVRNFGRDLWDPRFKDQRFAFHYVYYRTPPHIALLDNQYYLLAEPNAVQGLYDLSGKTPGQDLRARLSDRNQWMTDLTFGLYETAKYLLYNNPNPLRSGAANMKDRK